MNLDQYQKLEQLISQGNAGGPERLAKHIGVCERSVKHMISDLKRICDAPIEFNRKTNTYYYSVKGRCQFKFSPCIKEELKVELTTAVNAVVMKMLPVFSLCISLCFDI